MKRAALLVLCFAGSAHADSYQTHQTYGLDLSTLWEPRNRDAFAVGPGFRYETFSSRAPDWLGWITRFGLMVGGDRIVAPVLVGLVIRPGTSGFYGTLEGGASFSKEDDVMDDPPTRISWAVDAALGMRWRNWDMRVTAMRGEAFAGQVWLLSFGRDFGRDDSQITSKSLL